MITCKPMISYYYDDQTTIEEFAQAVVKKHWWMFNLDILCRFKDVVFEVVANSGNHITEQDIINAYLDELDNVQQYYLTPKGELCKHFGFNRYTGNHTMQPIHMEGRYIVEVLETFEMTEEYFLQCSPLRLMNPIKNED